MTDRQSISTPLSGTHTPLRHQLLMSHLTVAAVGLAALVVVLVLTVELSSRTARLAEVRGPAVRSSMQVMAGVQRSLAALRGWIVLGDESYRKERSAAWRDEIEPAFQELETLARRNPAQWDLEALAELRDQLGELKDNQWWIEEVAQTPGNQPARDVMMREVGPVADIITEAITACIDIEKTMEGDDRHALLAAMADLRGFFTRCRTALVSAVDRETNEDPHRYRRWLDIAQDRSDYLTEHRQELSAEQRELQRLISHELKAYDRLSSQVIKFSTSDQWNIARHRLETEAAPLADKATALLAAITARHSAAMQEDAANVMHVGKLSLVGTAALILAMSIVAVVVSARHAKRLSQPISALSAAAKAVADGEVQNDLQLTTKDELGELTKSFNTMRRRLEDRAKEVANANELLRQQGRRLQAVVRSAPVAMIMADSQGTIVLANTEAEKLFGYELHELRGQPVELLLPSRYRAAHPAQRERYMQAPEARRMASNGELFGLHKNGSEVPVEIGLNPITTEDGHFVLSAIVDISERKWHEAQLKQSREDALAASRSKSEFLANMSHEIRTPMNAIIGLTEIVLKSELNDLQRDYLSTVSASAEALLQIINDILDFSKIEAGKLRLERAEFQVRELVSDALKPLALKARSKNVTLVNRFADDVPEMIIGDPGRLRQVLTNLVGNAVKFTTQGHITVDVRLAPQSKQGDSTVKLEFVVEDTGIGVAAEKLSRIFKAFEQADTSTTRQYGGTGLGLSITSRLVHAMQGDISVESVLGSGATFRFTALFEPGAKQPAHSWREMLDRLDGARVLVVDDIPVNLTIMKDMISAHVSYVDACADGRAALSFLQTASTKGAPYSLVISDVHMPELDGYALAAEMAKDKQLRDIPVILVSSTGEPVDHENAKRQKIAGQLLKPVKQSELLELMVRALGLTQAANQEPAEQHSTLPQTNAGLRILLAEDSVANQKLALAVLSQAGHSTVVAETGKQAVDAVLSRQFDVVLMDVQMPEMDGYAATAAIRESDTQRGRHTPIVAMTAHAMTGDREKCLAAGMDDYVSKPLRPDELFAAIDRVLETGYETQTDTREEPPLIASSEIPWGDLLTEIGGNQDVLLEIVNAYAAEIAAVCPSITDSINHQNGSKLRHSAHKLKSALRYFRLTEAAKSAQRLEDFGASDDLTDADHEWLNLHEAVKWLEAALAEYCRSGQATMTASASGI